LKLVKAAYRLASDMPEYERYNLADQLRRAACSVVLNIAEGYGRYHYLERLQFMYLDYCTEQQIQWVAALREQIEKQLNGYCRFIRSQQQGSTEYGTKYIAEGHEVYGVSQSLIPSPQSQMEE
jgi:hypothetical protein